MSNIRSTKATLTLGEANAFIEMIGDMAAAQERMGRTSLRGSETFPHGNTVNAMNRWGLEPEEMAEWRSIMDRGFSAAEAADVVIRSRRGGR